MNITFIGAGNLATCLAVELFNKNYNIRQIYSRTSKSANSLACLVDADPITVVHDIDQRSDLYIVALSDAAIPDVVNNISFKDKNIVHTAGSVPMDVFDKCSSKYGVFYPLQTFSKQKSVKFEKIPIFIEANDDTLKESLLDIAKSISQKVFEVGFQSRKKMHLSAVFACNFVNHMLAISEKLMVDQGLEFDVFKPLLDETVSKAFSGSPLQLQTGPAIREDSNVMTEHIKMLENYPSFQEMYSFVSSSIIELNKKN